MIPTSSSIVCYLAVDNSRRFHRGILLSSSQDKICANTQLPLNLMPNCPRCHQSISHQEITCSHCGMILKAHGHPGIPLHRASEQDSLCQTCLYHRDDTCTFPQRPHAQECTLYTDQDSSHLEAELRYRPHRTILESLKLWCQRHPGIIGFLGLVAISIGLTLLSSS